MFVLEESQLLEDTIANDGVKKIYNDLKSYEEKGDISKLQSIIWSNSLINKFTQLLIKYKPTHGSCDELNPYFRIYYDDGELGMSQVEHDERLKKLSRDKKHILDELALSEDDAACLALTVSAALLEQFVIDNYTGPLSSDETKPILSDGSTINLLDKLRNEIDYKNLSFWSSEVHHKTVSPYLLYLAHVYWMYLNTNYTSRKLSHLEFLIRKHRLLTVHNSLLSDPSEFCMKELKKLEEYIFDHHILKGEENNTQLWRFNIAGLCTELIQSCLMRGAINIARKFHNFITEHHNVEVDYDGVLGRKTRFQEKDIPQLVVKVKESDGKSLTPAKEVDLDKLPVDLKLEDDTLLPDISFAKDQDDSNSLLSIEGQLILMSDLEIMMMSDVSDQTLMDESILAYTRTALKHTTIWSLRYKALAIRSKAEKSNHRRVDRALRQVEALIKSTEDSTSDGKTNRQECFYSVLPLSRCQMQRLLGDISFDLGLFKNALDVYEKIEHWEGMIKCLCALGRTSKAEELIRQELAKNESPYLYCLLGDVTENIEYYEKSWTLSNRHFARAKKSLGTYYYTRKDLKSAVEHYTWAHKASPSNHSILSLLAYCCLSLEDYKKAAEHYRNLTYLDDSNFLAWNNLTKAYINLDEKARAHKCILEAIKCNYEEWKCWDNLLMISLELGKVNDALLAWNRLMDLKPAFEDDQRLNLLTLRIIEQTIKSKDEDLSFLQGGLKLLGRIVSTGRTSPRVWICYFKLLMKEYIIFDVKDKDLDKEKEFKLKITKCLQRAAPSMPLIDSSWLVKGGKTRIKNLFSCFDEILQCYRYALKVMGDTGDLAISKDQFHASIRRVKDNFREKLGVDPDNLDDS